MLESWVCRVTPVIGLIQQELDERQSFLNFSEALQHEVTTITCLAWFLGIVPAH